MGNPVISRARRPRVAKAKTVATGFSSRKRKLTPMSFSRSYADESLSLAAFSYFEALDCPRALTAWLMLSHGELEQLVNLEVNPLDYLTAFDFRDAACASKFLSKYSNFDIPSIDRKAVAKKKFFEAEEICRQTNSSVRRWREDPSKLDPAFNSILRVASLKIAALLGDVDWNVISDRFGWGPGATSSVRGTQTSAYNKFYGPLDVTRNALVIGNCCVNSIPAWAAAAVKADDFPTVPVSVLPSAFNIVKGNEIIFVPKNAKTDRVIAVEPHVNSYLQKGVGAFIRERLRTRAGIDLNDQSVNQRLAYEGSLHGHLATLDLSMASDTVSRELVRELLPCEWFNVLSSMRSEFGVIRDSGEEVFYEKFSSMGNGYTFELESLIFWAVCKAACEYLNDFSFVSIFGDDIIVPVGCYDLVVRVLNSCGFRVNESKSFCSGPFRESCGEDFFFGHSVRPLYLKERLSHVEGLYKLANSFRRHARRRNFGYGCDRRFRNPWSVVVQRIPSYYRRFISDGFGDVALIGNLDEACPPRARNGWEGYTCRVILRVPRKGKMTGVSAAIAAMLCASGPLDPSSYKRLSLRDQAILDQKSKDGLPLEGEYTFRRSTVPTNSTIHVGGWCNLGPWL